jgi:hypothetical protein
MRAPTWHASFHLAAVLAQEVLRINVEKVFLMQREKRG